MEQHENSSEEKRLVTRHEREINMINHEVEELRQEVKQLREDLELIDLSKGKTFNLKPVNLVDVIGVTGFFVIVAIAAIGIFFF